MIGYSRRKILKCLLSLLVATLAVGSVNRSNSATLTVTLNVGKPVYNIGNKANIWGNVTNNGNPVSDALVAIEVDNPRGNPVIIRVKTTGTPTSSSLIKILGLIPCDATGNPSNNFERGKLGYFDIVLNNTGGSPQYAEVTLNILDVRNVPFEAFAAYNGFLYAGTTEFLIPEPIPPDIAPGNATAYANVLTAMPSLGGYALCPEQSATFSIVGANPPPPTPEQSSTGAYNLTFTIDNYAKTRLFPSGTYNVSATCNYQNVTVTVWNTFDAVLTGDINRDGTVDIFDAVLLSNAFNSSPGSPKWNSNADLNGDGIVDIFDAIILSGNFGRTA